MTLEECYRAVGGDLAQVQRRLPSMALIERFVAKFLSDDSYAQLCRAMEAGQREEAFRAAHTLKGVCQNLSFTVLASSASACTEALRAGDLAGGKQLFAQVETDYQALVSALSQVGNG